MTDGPVISVRALTREYRMGAETVHAQRYHTVRAGQSLSKIAKRYRVDALLIPTVTDLQSHPPQRLGLKVEMVSTETGQPIWSSAIQLDAAREDVRRGLEAWAMQHVGDVSQTTWELTLISPRRMARFAAFQIAALI